MRQYLTTQKFDEYGDRYGYGFRWQVSDDSTRARTVRPKKIWRDGRIERRGGMKYGKWISIEKAVNKQDKKLLMYQKGKIRVKSRAAARGEGYVYAYNPKA